MKIKRMEAAAELLVSEPQLSICEVAEAAGYENQSKFPPLLSQLWALLRLHIAANRGELIGLKFTRLVIEATLFGLL